MGYYAKKTMTGLKPVSDEVRETADAYVQSVDEYDKANREITFLNRELSSMKEKYRQELADIKADCTLRLQEQAVENDRQLETIRQEYEGQSESYEKQIQHLTLKLEEAKNDILRQKTLQRNLLRICRERANQQRNLHPKKEHDGYIVLEYSQYIEHYKEEVWETGTDKEMYTSPENRRCALQQGILKIMAREVCTWRSILQTPYDATIPLSTIEPKIIHDLWADGGILKEMGCLVHSEAAANGSYYRFIDDKGEEICGCFRWRFRTNFRSSKLWEIELYTTDQLIVPAYRLPQTGKHWVQ